LGCEVVRGSSLWNHKAGDSLPEFFCVPTSFTYPTTPVRLLFLPQHLVVLNDSIPPDPVADWGPSAVVGGLKAADF